MDTEKAPLKDANSLNIILFPIVFQTFLKHIELLYNSNR
jgi:hypothetical protein